MNIFNRIVLTVIGIATLMVGIAGFAYSQSWISANRLNDLVRQRDVWDWWNSTTWTDAQLWLLAAASLVVAVLALAIVVRELLPPRSARDTRMIVIEQSDRGSTTLRTKALRRALEHDAATTDGVSSAHVDDLNLDNEPTVALRVRGGADRDLVVAGREVCDRIARSLAIVIGREPLRVDVDLDVRPAKAPSPQRKVA